MVKVVFRSTHRISGPQHCGFMARHARKDLESWVESRVEKIKQATKRNGMEWKEEGRIEEGGVEEPKEQRIRAEEVSEEKSIP